MKEKNKNKGKLNLFSGFFYINFRNTANFRSSTFYDPGNEKKNMTIKSPFPNLKKL